MPNFGQKRTTCHRKNRPNQINYVQVVTQSGISSDLDQFEEPTADAEAPEPGSPQPGQPGQTPGGSPGGTGGTGGGGQV